MNKYFTWDGYSDQPHIIKDKTFKKKIRKRYRLDLILMILSSCIILPISFMSMFFFKKKATCKKDFYGLGVNLDKGNEQIALIEELGVKNLLIRLPLCDIQNLNSYYEFAKSFGDDKNIVLNILQDRKNIEDLALLEKNLTAIFERFDGFVYEYQIGNAINRLKWGFFSPKEYLDFYAVAYKLKQEKFPHVTLIGSSVIDFEYYYTTSTLFNFKPIRYDIVSSLLYVDRRGSPYNKQSFFFDFKAKIDLLYSMVRLSSKTKDRIYITETNYPISNTAPYAPTSEFECVSHEQYVRYMQEYHEIALKSGKIQKIFWHQLIAPGYGLVDNRGEKLLKLPQFYAYKEMIKNHKEKEKI